MNTLYTAIFVLSLFSVVFLSFRKSKHVKDETSFLLAGRKLSAFGVFETIFATILGGASTVGTVQLAYKYGIAAGIYTFAAGLACFFLGRFFAAPLRESESITVSEFIGSKFGKKAQVYTSFFSSFGITIQVIAQFLSGMAVIQAVFTQDFVLSFFITFVLVAVFVMFGGLVSSNVIGKLKFYMFLSLLLASLGIMAYHSNFFMNVIFNLPKDRNYFSLFNYGWHKSTTDIISSLIGVISTQIYLQAIFGAKDIRSARRGAYICSVAIPIVGVISCMIGMYMRVYHPEIAHNTFIALPYFINHYFPLPLAAFFSAALFIIVLGSISGLLLGLTTNFYVDFLQYFNILKFIKTEIVKLRIITFALLCVTFSIFFSGSGVSILRYTYFSMGLRGATILLALLMIIFFKRFTDYKVARYLIYILPIVFIVFSLLNML